MNVWLVGFFVLVIFLFLFIDKFIMLKKIVALSSLLILGTLNACTNVETSSNMIEGNSEERDSIVEDTEKCNDVCRELLEIKGLPTTSIKEMYIRENETGDSILFTQIINYSDVSQTKQISEHTLLKCKCICIAKLFTNLKELAILDGQNAIKHILKSLCYIPFPKLMMLTIDHCELPEESDFTKMSSLVDLRLQRISGAKIIHLGKNLERLSISESTDIESLNSSIKGRFDLEAISSLKYLFLCKIKNLQELALPNSLTEIFIIGIENLEKNTLLDFIDLSLCSKLDLLTVDKLPSLKKVFLPKKDIKLHDTGLVEDDLPLSLDNEGLLIEMGDMSNFTLILNILNKKKSFAKENNKPFIPENIQICMDLSRIDPVDYLSDKNKEHIESFNKIKEEFTGIKFITDLLLCKIVSFLSEELYKWDEDLICEISRLL